MSSKHAGNQIEGDIIPNIGKGWCLFASLAQGLSDIGLTTTDHQALRREILDFLLKNPNKVVNSQDEGEITIETMIDYTHQTNTSSYYNLMTENPQVSSQEDTPIVPQHQWGGARRIRRPRNQV